MAILLILLVAHAKKAHVRIGLYEDRLVRHMMQLGSQAMRLGFMSHTSHGSWLMGIGICTHRYGVAAGLVNTKTAAHSYSMPRTEDAAGARAPRVRACIMPACSLSGRLAPGIAA